MTTQLLTLLVVLDAVLLVVMLARPRVLAGAGGRVVAFLAFFLLPVAALGFGTVVHLEKSKSTEFCLSCHEMQPYGQSLMIDSSDALPAQHYQNKRIDREHACFSCHTDYTMYGDVAAKMRGLRHLWVHYAGTIPATIELYTPYQNRECLHCHGGARSFEDNEIHQDIRSDLASGETSCLECHDTVHEVADLAGQTMWKPEGDSE